MRVRALVHVILPASAILLVACEGRQPLDPSAATELTVAAARSASDPVGPSSTTAVGVSETQIDVAWQDNSIKRTGFEVHRSSTGEGGSFFLLATTAANITRHSDQWLAFGTPLCYKIRAVQRVGNKTTYSAFSNTACAAAPPNAPTNFVAVAAPNTFINLTWQDNSNAETSYQVFRQLNGLDSFFLLATTAANTTAYADQPATAGTRHCYQVGAVRKSTLPDGSFTYSYSARSNTECAVAPAPLPPAAASNSTASPTSSFGTTVRWTDNATNEDGFRVYRSTDGGTAWVLAGTAPRAEWGVPQFDDSGLQSEQQVCYRVVAFNSGGEAPSSNTGCTTPPAGPSDLTATRVGAETVRFNWSDNSAVEDGYQLWVRWAHGDCNASTGWYEGESLIAELPIGSTSYDYTPVELGCGPDEPGSYYGYFVVAARDGGRSSPSADVALP